MSARASAIAARFFLIVVAVAAFASMVACGGKAPEAPARDPGAPQWQDAFDGTEAIVFVVRPEALKRDQVYGPLFEALTRLGAARSGAAVRSMEAVGTAEEVICGVESDGSALLVARGVRADLDPEKLTDDAGARLFRFGAEIKQVRELVSDRDDASLFVLPQRTWVVATGASRARARQAYAIPFGRPVPSADPSALALARFEGASLVKSVPQLGRGSFAPLSTRLTSVTVALAPGTGGLVATFSYDDDGAAAFAELRARDIVTRLVAEGGARFVWLKDAKVERDGAHGPTVRVSVAVPPVVVAELKRATTGDIAALTK